MASEVKSKRAKRPRRAAEDASPPIPPSGDGFDEAIDEVRATVIALLASLRAKENDLREGAGPHPAPGVLAGLNDIGAIRVWADRTLRTLDVLSRGKTGEVSRLLEELGEFQQLVEGVTAASPESSPPE